MRTVPHEAFVAAYQHMFETLQVLLAFRGPGTKAVIWEHNSHVGNAAATEMGARGELNVGQLARETFKDAAYAIGFGTDHGTVAAASDWDGPMEIKAVRPAHPESYERVCHQAGGGAFLLPLRYPRRADVRDELSPARLERAIGVIYRPETELASHYFQAVLPAQFDEYIWFDENACRDGTWRSAARCRDAGDIPVRAVAPARCRAPHMKSSFRCFRTRPRLLPSRPATTPGVEGRRAAIAGVSLRAKSGDLLS